MAILLGGLASPSIAAERREPSAPTGAHRGEGTFTLPTLATVDQKGQPAYATGKVTLTKLPDKSGVVTAACFQAWEQVYANNVTGDRIWDYTVYVDFCYDGFSVTSISPSQNVGHVYGWAAALGWSYGGVRDKAQWDYYGDKWVYRTYSQGAFDYCPPRIICIQHQYPQIWIDTYGDGWVDYYWNV